MEIKISSCESEALLSGPALWQAIQEFDLDGDSPLPFSKRLARDNDWSPAFASRVVEEYKKFVFLAMEAGHLVTPSDEVDQAWHLHLCYTRSYWDQMCGQVLGRPLHHGPTKGGAQERAKYTNLYEKTLDSYRAHFASEPPSDIWPPTSVRFGRASSWRRVSLHSHWVLKKPSLRLEPRLEPRLEAAAWKPSLGLAGGLVALCVAMLLGGDVPQVLGASLGGINIFHWEPASFLALFWGLCVAGALAVTFVRGALSRPGVRSFARHEPDSCSVARLTSGGNDATDAALGSPQRAGKISIGAGGQIVRPRLAGLDAAMQRDGLLVEPSLAARVSRVSFSIPLALLLIGLAKIAVEMSHGRPAGPLCVTCGAIALVMLFSRGSRPRCGKRGGADLDHPRAQAKSLGRTLVGGAVAMLLALWGYSTQGMAQTRSAMMPDDSSINSDTSIIICVVVMLLFLLLIIGFISICYRIFGIGSGDSGGGCGGCGCGCGG